MLVADAPSIGVVPSRVVDFGVRGILRVRTYDAEDGDLAAVARDVGPPTETGGEPPDLIVRFVEEVSHTLLHHLDGGAMGYGSDGVYVLDSSQRRTVARVSQGEKWGEALIVCRRGLGRIPFLSAALDLAALSRGWAPLHGSAWVTKQGSCVVVTGWARSGKTGALLAACARGATPVGDDRVLVARDGSRVVGVGRPIVVKDWHLAQLPLPALGARPVRRALARAAPILDTLPASKLLRRLRGMLSVALDPQRLIGASDAPAEPRPDVLVILETHDHPSIESERVDARTAASRIAAQVEAELLPTVRAQTSFEYAFPGRGWRDVRRAAEVAEGILGEATRGVPTYVVRHPYPCSLKRLDQAIGRVAE